MRTLSKVFSQQDPAWASLLLGTSKTNTIGQDGCYLTSMAMVASYYGKDTDPNQLNQYLIKNNLYVNEDLIGGDNTLNTVYPDINFEQDYFYPNTPPTPADLTLLHSLLDDPTVSVILEINEGNHQHYVVCVGCNGTTTIADPWTGTIVNFADVYGDPSTNIIKFIVFSGTPATTTIAPLMYKGLNLNDTASMKVAVDIWNAVVNENQYVDAAEYTNLQNLYNGVTKDNKNLHDELTSIYTTMAAYHKSDSTTVDQGQVAIQEADDVKAAFDKLTKTFGIEGPFSSYLDTADQILSKVEIEEEKEVPPAPTVTASPTPPISMTTPSTGFFSKVLSGLVSLFYKTESKS